MYSTVKLSKLAGAGSLAEGGLIRDEDAVDCTLLSGEMLIELVVGVDVTCGLGVANG